MPKEIVLENVTKTKDTVSYDLSIDDKKFKIDYRFAAVNCVLDLSKVEERFDPIVVSLMYHALTRGYDFRSEYPISNELLYRLTYQFVPQMLRCAPKDTLHSVEIAAPLKEIEDVNDWIGLDIACDVDHLASAYENTHVSEIPESRLTHLIHINTGARHDTLIQSEINGVRSFRERARSRLIIINSNIARMIKDAFDDPDYNLSHTFRDCGAVTVLQNFFRRFYYSTAHNLDEFSVDTSRDCSYYDRWFLPFISSNRLHFYLSDCRGMTRFQKLRFISDYQFSYDTLHVCRQNEKHCGHCADCRYTLVALDMLDALKRYKSVFDLDEYQKLRAEHVNYIFEHRNDDPSFKELCMLMPDDMKHDDIVFKVSTFHNTNAYFDGDAHLCHKNPVEIKGDHYPLYARLCGDKISLFCVKDECINYINGVDNSAKPIVDQKPMPLDIIRNSDGSISIKIGNSFLRAARTDENLSLQIRNGEWEHFFLRDADFTYNQLSNLKNFLPFKES